MGRYAHKHGFPLESVEVRTTYEVDFAPAVGPVESVAFLSKMRCEVEIRGPLTERQFAELKWIADNCPMGNTLRRGLMLDQKVSWLEGPSACATPMEGTEDKDCGC